MAGGLMMILFWLSGALAFYIYIGYPLLLAFLGRRQQPTAPGEGPLPRVSILIAAYNEEKDIEQTLRNKLALDYPKELLEILVVSDESTDRTDSIVEAVARESQVPIHLVRQEPRQGKTAGLNLIAPRARGDILVFSDANSLYAPDALRHLVRRFSDPNVGYVTGRMVYANPDGSMVGDGCSAYMRYENRLREWESVLGSIVGVDGGIDAMRAELYQPLRPDQLPDFVQPLKVVEQGYRVVYEPAALLKESALNRADREYGMRVRVSLRALWALHDMRHLMDPSRYGVFAIQLISHKLLRYLAFVPLALLFLSNLFLAGKGGLYGLCMLGQLAFYGLAGLGYRRRNEGYCPAYLAFPFYFCLLNLASAHAVWRYLKGEKQVVWVPRVG